MLYIVLATVILLIIITCIVAYYQIKVLPRKKAQVKGGSANTSSARNATKNESATKIAHKKARSPLSILAAATVALLGAITARLGFMQLIQDKDFSQRAADNVTRKTKIAAPRGKIYDRDGVELVTNRPMTQIVATNKLKDDPCQMQLLANLLAMPYEALVRRAKGGDIASASGTASQTHVLASNVTLNTLAYIAEHPDLFSDITIEQSHERSYSQSEFAAHVLGYTSTASKDQIEKAKGTENELQEDDVVGQAGVESYYDDILQGTPGEKRLFVNAQGSVIGEAETLPAVPGTDIVLTINSKIQKGAEEGLKHGIAEAKRHGMPAKAAAVVCLAAQTGEVLALASYPSYDPSSFIGGISADDWDALSNDNSGYPMLNRVVSGLYPSASTIKPLSALTGLEQGVMSESEYVDCVGFWTGFGKESGQWCWNHKGHGWLDLEEGIINSCNTVFYEIGKRIFESPHKEALQDTFKRWGLGSRLNIDLPSEEAGRIPTPEWKQKAFPQWSDSDRQWYGGDTTNIAIGQGDILVTPLQMAAVYMGLANGGTIYKPHVLKGVATKDGTGTIVEHGSEVLYQIDTNTQYAQFIKASLAGVIAQEDPAVAAHFSNLPVKVAGKTGTAEQPQKEPTGWFCCYAPADNPEYVIAALVEEGGFGANSAMYIARDTLGAIYDTPDTSKTVSTNQAM